MIWPGNSPDLNMIEPCWFYLKRQVWTPAIHHEMIACWEEEWENLDQERIQRWVERIHHHIQEVI